MDTMSTVWLVYSVLAVLQQHGYADAVHDIAKRASPFGNTNNDATRTRKLRPVDTPLHIRTIMDSNYDLGVLEYIGFIERQQNCTMASLAHFTINLPEDVMYGKYERQMDATVNAANMLSSLFQTPKIKKRMVNKRVYSRYDDSFYLSVVRSMVDNDRDIFGSVVAFRDDLVRNERAGRFCPYAYRDRKRGLTVINDLSQKLQYTHNLTAGCEWYREQRYKDFSHLQKNRSDTLLALGRTEEFVSNGSLILASKQDGQWSRPYVNCAKVPNWIVTYSVPFFGLDTGDFIGVVAIDIDLMDIDVNQCVKGGPFGETHRCPTETTKCEHMPGNGFRRGSYRCYCLEGRYFPPEHNNDSNRNYFNGSLIEDDYIRTLNGDLSYTATYNNRAEPLQCLPCALGCTTCINESRCDVEYDLLLRGIPLGIQSFCMTITIVIGFIIIRLRKSRVMKSSMWLMLEIIIFGALLLFSTVVIQYFKPTNATCLLIPWFRELGFAVVYGALILKVYRVLAEFQSRKAHRVHVRDRDLLKYLLGITLVVVGYMSAWTAVNMDHVRENASLIDHGIVDGVRYDICKSHWWDYVIEVGEFLFMLLGIYLCYCIRAAPSEYGEARYAAWAIYNETIVSTLLYVSRHFLWLSLNPDYIFLMYFIRCQLTVTVTLILVLGPKLWYAHRPPDEDQFRNRAFSQSDVHDTILPESMKLHVGVSSNGDVDVGEINLSEMDPEDIRAELKRLYTQLQIYKTKTMRKDNPHISKRRGGRKQTHRRFSLQAFHHKHHRSHHHHDEHHDELSKTPEESTNSAEGLAIALDGSSRTDEHVLPSVTFKHK